MRFCIYWVYVLSDYAYTQFHTHARTYTHAQTQTYMHACTHTHAHTCARMRTYTQMSTLLLLLYREGLQILEENASLFRAENPTILASGNWRTFSLFDKGKKNADNCNLTPKTCALLDSLRDASECTHGQVSRP